MEIINCIQKDYRRKSFWTKIKFDSFSQKNKYFSKTVLYPNFSQELKSFSAQKIKPHFTINLFFTTIGNFLNKFERIVIQNIKLILIYFSIISLFLCLSLFAYKIIDYKTNYSNALTLQVQDCLDIEKLNSLMDNFALEGQTQIDDSGKILDTPFVLQNLTKPVSYQNYTVKSGDTISTIAKKFGLNNISTLISVNDIGNVRQLAAGQKLKIPSIDGIIYSVKKGDSLNSICAKNDISFTQLLDVNELNSDILVLGQQLFLPGVGLDKNILREAMGDMFKMPISAKFRWSSPFGNRIDPIAGVKSFHTGTDMACPTGTPILASMSGKVTTTGTTRVYGNYVIIDHQNGYQTLYAHMSKILAKKGQWVSQGTRIGLVGSTGYSTGPHLHFTVYKNGKIIDPMSVLK